MDIYLNSTGPIQALKGERLVLNCTATGKLNTRVNITWDYPGKVRPHASRFFCFFFTYNSSDSKKCLSPAHSQLNNHGVTSKRLVKHPTHMLFYNILTLPRLQQSDRGTYTCHVSSGENAKQEQVDVTVYGGEPRQAAAARLLSQTLTQFFFPSHFRSTVYPPQAETRVGHRSAGGTESFQDLTQTASVPST